MTTTGLLRTNTPPLPCSWLSTEHVEPQNRRPLARRLVSASVAMIGIVLSGCGVVSDKQQATVSNLTHYAESYDHVAGSENNLLDKALAECSEKLAKTENVCVRQAVDDAHLSLKALVAQFPNCSLGKVCHYDHTTQDNLGHIEATAAAFVVRWRVEADFRNYVTDVAHLPLKVTNRDDFGDPTKDAAKKLEKPVPLVQVLPEKP